MCSVSKDGEMSFAPPPDLHWVTTLPAGHCYDRHCCFSQGTQAGGEEGAQLGQGSRTMVQGQQDQARKYAFVSGLEDGATFSQLQ